MRQTSILFAFGLYAVLPSALGAQDNRNPILSAVNLAGPAMTYDGIEFAADDGMATGQTGEEGAGGNDGPNGLQVDLVGTPFASVRWAPEVRYSVAAPPGPAMLDLYFMEGWYAGAGRRIMTIEIEGQVVREDFDIVAASGGDFNVPQVLRFSGIDPAAFGDPGRIEIRVREPRDNAVLSAVVLRCDGTAETCAARLAEGETDTASASISDKQDAEANAVFTPEHWHGVWEFIRPIEDYDTKQTVLERSVLVIEPDRVTARLPVNNVDNYVNCQARFTPGDQPRDMTFLFEDCPGFLLGPIETTPPSLSATSNGDVRLTRIFRGATFDFVLKKTYELERSPRQLPLDTPLETGGITLPATLAEVKAQIEERYPSEGDTSSSSTDELWWVETLEAIDGDIRTIGMLNRYTRYVYPAPEGFMIDRLFQNTNVFIVFALEDRPDSPVMAVVRRWWPPSAMFGDAPGIETTRDALAEKYGSPSDRIVAEYFSDGAARSGAFGLSWAFDRDGSRRSAPCAGNVQAVLDPLRIYRIERVLNRTFTPYVDLRSECGFEIRALHTILPGGSPDQPLEVLEMALIDHEVLSTRVYALTREKAEARDQRLRDLQVAREAAQAKRNTEAEAAPAPDEAPVVQPDL